MKILLITDQHFGVRNDNTFYTKLYQKFYNNVVIPYIDREGITQVIALGDTFDRRKYVNFHSLDACLLYTSPSPRDGLLSRMPSSA